MEENKKSFLVNLITGFLVAVAVFILGMSREYSLLRCLSDCFFVAAVLLLGFGGIKYVRNKGAFDVAGYGMMAAVHMFLPFTKSHSRLENREEDFMDYKERVEKKRKSASGELKAGAIYLALALVMLGIYMLTK